MWSPNATTVHVGLSPHAVVLAYRTDHWQRQRWHVQEHPCGPDGGGWAKVLPVLARALAALNLPHARLKVHLGGAWVHWLLMPWNSELVSTAEYQAYAKAQFEQNFGPLAEHWLVVHRAQRPGSMQAACAVDAALVSGLQETLQPLGARLEAVAPYSSSAFDQWQGHMFDPDSWFCALEPDTLWLARLKNGGVQALHVQRWSDRWQDALAATMETLELSLQQSGTQPNVYIASPLPPVASKPQWPFTWVRAQGLVDRQPSAIRLALGV